METEESIFVGRKTELEQLSRLLDQIVVDKPSLQLCLIEGERGDGKTALVEHFAEEAKKNNRNLDYAIGTCDISTGKNEIYDPFRDIFSQLAGIRAKGVTSLLAAERGFDAHHLAQITVNVLSKWAPELLGTLVPIAGLISKAALIATNEVIQRRMKVLENEEGTVKHSEIRWQSVKFFEKRVYEGEINKPLILIFDDVQWIDELSLELLDHLIKSLKDLSMLIILTYRREFDEGARIGKLINHIKERYEPLIIDLRTSRNHAFVEEFLKGNNCWVENREFVDAFFEHTGGQPIFMVELLHFLQVREILKRNVVDTWEINENHEFKWMSKWGKELNQDAKLEVLIDSHLRQLSNELQEVLKLASIQGFEFIAQVIANITGLDERKILRNLCNDLGKKQGLIQEINEERVGDTVISHLRFTNVTYQQQIYASMSVGERRLLHYKVAQSLEALYKDDTSDIAIDLARHYEIGQAPRKAVDYLIKVGRQQIANVQRAEASETFNQAISLARGEKYIEGLIDAMRFLAVEIKLVKKEDRKDAEKLLEECIELSRKCNNLEALSYGLRGMGRVYRNLHKDNNKAMYYYMDSLSVARQINDEKQIGAALTNIGIVLKDQGHFEEARRYYRDRLKLAEKIDHEEGMVAACMNLCEFELLQGNFEEAERFIESAEEVNTKLNDQDRSAGIKTIKARVKGAKREFKKAADFLIESIRIANEFDLPKRDAASLSAFVEFFEPSQFHLNASEKLFWPQVIVFIGKEAEYENTLKTRKEFLLGNGIYTEHNFGEAEEINHQLKPNELSKQLVKNVLKLLSSFTPESESTV